MPDRIPSDTNPLGSNREMWNRLAEVHSNAPHFYHIEQFRAGESALHPLEIKELAPDVPGRTLLHLQCHFGLDTLSWLRHGAEHVTGVDFSPKAIQLAQQLARDVNLEKRAGFVESTIADLPDNLTGQFDIVYTSYGVLCWLPDLTRWAQVIDHFLKPGGIFYIAEYHPVSYILDDESDTFAIRYPYFSDGRPQKFEVEGSYADPDANVNRTSYEWVHTLGEIVTVLAQVGLHIEYLHEFDVTNFQPVRFMDPVDERHFRLKTHAESIPLMFSLRATK